MTAEEFNAEHSVGVRVLYYPIMPPIDSAPPIETATRSEAWTLPGGHHVVLINGKSGGVRLSHVEVLP